MIDVMFILMVFFMLVSNFDDIQSITLATASNTSGHAVEKNMIVILSEDGSLKLDGQSQAISLDHIIEQAGDRRIILRVLSNVSLQLGVDVLDSLRSKGLNNITLQPSGEINKVFGFSDKNINREGGL